MTQTVQVLATVLFGLAILHTFAAGKIQIIAHHAKAGSMRAKLLHLLGEVEIVFGLWAALFVALFAMISGPREALMYVDGVDFTEAAFVFAVMAVTATRGILALATGGIEFVADAIVKALPMVSRPQAFYFVTLVLGPLMGSFITEPAAMTVCALILKERFFRHPASDRFKYKTLALLFVNVSIGGVLTHFAAPPVVMVAKTWGWDSRFMIANFGYKAAIAVVINTLLTLYFLRKDFARFNKPAAPVKPVEGVPYWIIALNVVFLVLVVFSGHHMAVFLGLFMLFFGVMSITEKHQGPFQLREPMLVGFFLAGLVVLGKPQSWWLSPLITSLSEFPLYIGATLVTAVTDNAALTYLGAQVPNLASGLKYALVAGAITGGGLTVIANAPNPAGYGILKDHFGEDGVKQSRLAVAALVPTAIASFCLEVL